MIRSAASRISRVRSRRISNSRVLSEKSTHFGEKTVKVEEKQGLVNSVFNNVADSYDVMNDVMSFGVHRCWKESFVRELAPRPGTRMLDMAGGTGDISFKALQFAQKKYGRAKANFEITVSDINTEMLRVGEKRAKERDDVDESCLTFQAADAHELPFEDNSFDYYTIAFGIRNCTDIDKVLDEAYRVLKPGGRFMCLEFSPNVCPAIKPFYDFYSFQVIPPMGQVVAGDWDSYQYLVESIRKFPDQERFKMMIEGAGFEASKKLSARYVVQAYNRRALRRNVEESRALKFPDSETEDQDAPVLKKARCRKRTRRHRPPPLELPDSTRESQKATLQSLALSSAKNDACIAGSLDDYPFVAFSSIREFKRYESGALSPKNLPSSTLSASPPFSPNSRKKNNFSRKLPKPQNAENEERNSPIRELLDPKVNYFEAIESSSFYFPDTESISSRGSGNTEQFFRPQSVSLREKLPSSNGLSRTRKRKTQKPRRTVKRETRETLDSRLHRQVFTYQHHHQHSHHHTMALPIFPLGMNWPFLHLNDPLLMATLQHQSLNLALHKPLKTAPTEKKKSKPKESGEKPKSGEREEPVDKEGKPGTSKPRTPSASTAKWIPSLPRRGGTNLPSAFSASTGASNSAASNSNFEKALLETQVQDLRNRSLDLLQTVASLRQTLAPSSTLRK
ncbi:Oidioi.mRNA.OKI2018_I69.XSR.g16855.t1.cds [Oikopleura dioica]|uniref:2-methoxy-6-polyprenyl-1,4-benzoquinol methylase, mitochondrial n=1 Tax=Oikopleura dioica TaxID=34765 RepID=A0ABN7SHF1_OIKDI|nr:Oidioi.mRNA.OKI2018_I69.XSR.g16855.t1.cds [Oikopleura dioica]